MHVLGGGITRLWRNEYPAPLNACLALRIMVHPTEADRDHEMVVLLLAEDGQEQAKVGINFTVGSNDTQRRGEELSAAFAVPLFPVGLPSEGAYSFELLIDGVHQASVPFVCSARKELES